MLEALQKRIPPPLLNMPVAVISGGSSQEREVSLRSGKRVLDALLRLGIAAFSLEADHHLAAQLLDRKVRLAFLATHGVPGEDGSLQGLLDGLSISYTGAGVVGSVLALHKTAAKTLLKTHGVCTPEHIELDREKPAETQVHHLAKTLGFPMVLKPLFGGSSIGIRLCHDLRELRTSLELLWPEHPQLFAESYVKGRELTVSILEDARGRPYCLPILELSSRHLFYDYECKTDEGLTDFLVPAELPSSVEKKLLEASLTCHRVLALRDFSRSDFLLDEQNNIAYLETNSIPGLTELSDLPAQARAYGMIFEEVALSILINAYHRL